MIPGSAKLRRDAPIRSPMLTAIGNSYRRLLRLPHPNSMESRRANKASYYRDFNSWSGFRRHSMMTTSSQRLNL